MAERLRRAGVPAGAWAERAGEVVELGYDAMKFDPFGTAGPVIDREALDRKISPNGAGGKILPHEIASKTQMFTERYIVEWLLQNSLGLTWLCMCKKHGWTADAAVRLSYEGGEI
jgi:hypothetical protein